MVDAMSSEFALQVLEIVWINILLSGDNAVVIALACRSLNERQRKWGVIIGSAAAVALRIAFTLVVARLMEIPFLKLVGGLLLLWIAVKLLTDETDESDIKASHTVRAAVQTIVIADLVMSLDNVVAIAAAARGSLTLIIFGLVLSVPLIVFGATLIIRILERYPVLVWAGAGLLGWIAGGLIASDAFVHSHISQMPEWFGEKLAPAIGAALVLAIAWLWRQRQAASARA